MSRQEQDIGEKLYGSTSREDTQRDALLNGDVPVAVYGLGKMGLPLAAVYAETTENVVGVDVDPEVVDAINRGECHVKREPGLDDAVRKAVANDWLSASGDPRSAARGAAVHVVIVPILVDDENTPDLSVLGSVLEDVAAGLDPGDLVVIESTVPPRTCVDYVRPKLLEESGLDAEEFGVAYCPERTSSGRALEDIRGAYPKVVGGDDAESSRAATLVYGEITDAGVQQVSDTTTAEAVKLFEGLYRDVNIALANELAKFTDELAIDANEAIEVANAQPYCDIHTPGPGVGGHCIPIYPHFLIGQFHTDSPLLRTARRVNDGMPAYTVKKLRDALNVEGVALDGASILVLGLTYRAGVKETRKSPSLDVVEELDDAGCSVVAVDPLLDEVPELAAELIDLDAIYDRDFDGVVVVTPHSDFDDITWGKLSNDRHRLVVVDGRQSLDLSASGHLAYTIGTGYDV